MALVRRRLKWTALILAVSVAAVVAGLWIYPQIVGAAVWKKLSARVPAQALQPGEGVLMAGPVSSVSDPYEGQVGHVELANGDIWRFAFRSHHGLGREDSFSVFAGPLGTFRARGDYFCCEVQFQDESALKDSDTFLAFLSAAHGSVERER